ncbi:MAG: bifunctional pyr operon transcriptional regulator/uracil phosphoribosyltransferase PyrR [Mariprofundaceae bacterium]|nr:bifunctional pyr operon transcriptional regulator/uracil phosphoribosyltransferase PyrR [Mariprofundaceae bacterium]
MNGIIFENKQIRKSLKKMAQSMTDTSVYLVGIQRGGSQVANALQKRLKKEGCNVVRGNLDISFYRDDLDRSPLHPVVHGSDLPFDINDRHIWLVDDVIFSGRTIRAALGELFDYGRPASVSLAVLVDRGGRQLPIQPNVIGLSFSAPADHVVDLTMCKNAAGKAVWSISRRLSERKACSEEHLP